MGENAQVVCSFFADDDAGLGLVAAAYLWVQTATPGLCLVYRNASLIGGTCFNA